MIKKLLPVIVIAVAAIAGGGGGFLAKSMLSKGAKPEAHADAEGGETDDGHGKKAKKKKGGHGGEAEDVGSTTYMKFSRQFVVPVIEKGRPKAMVILDLNIEVDNSLNESAYSLEPRLRDALLSRLIALAGEGMLPQMLEDAEKMDAMKAALLETSRSVMGDAAKNVLVLDLGMQNY
ncbi:MAG: flagellar basal body-associated FliL family protein [Parvularculaceae bacterium]